MENKAHALAAGLFVVALIALLVVMGLWLTRETGVRHVYEISTRETISGLQEQAPVRLRGVEVGKVTAIGFDATTRGNVLVRMEIDRAAPLTRATFAELGYQGVTGLAYVQLGDDGSAAPVLEPDDARPPRIPLRPGLLSQLESRGTALLTQVEQAAGRINQLLGDENQRRFSSALARIDDAAADTQRLAQRLDATVQQRVDPLLAEGMPALRAVRGSAEQIERTAAEFSATAALLNARNGPLERLAEGTEMLSSTAQAFNNATLPRINRASDDASRAARQLGRAVNNINDNPQSLLFGTGTPPPGPGEPGFTVPGGAR